MTIQVLVIIFLQFYGRRYTWDIEEADVKKPILGADFLSAHGLTGDLQGSCIRSNDDPNLVLPCTLHILPPLGSSASTTFSTT